MDKKTAIRLAAEKAGGLSALSHQLSVARPTLSIWLAGRRPVPLVQGVKIEQMYGVRAEYLCPDYKHAIYYLRGTKKK